MKDTCISQGWLNVRTCERWGAICNLHEISAPKLMKVLIFTKVEILPVTLNKKRIECLNVQCSTNSRTSCASRFHQFQYKVSSLQPRCAFLKHVSHTVTWPFNAVTWLINLVMVRHTHWMHVNPQRMHVQTHVNHSSQKVVQPSTNWWPLSWGQWTIFNPWMIVEVLNPKEDPCSYK